MRHQAPRKRFGQNFLTDEHVIAEIVDSLMIDADTHVVEIGPGRAALTHPIAQRVKAVGAELSVVEIDRDLAGDLPIRLLPFELPKGHLIQSDALKVNFSELKATTAKSKFVVVGNLPYNISTPILFHLMKFAADIDFGVFMLQKEVVERITAGPGNKTFGRLSVMMQYHAELESLLTVLPGAFYPPPKVTSAVFRLTPFNTPPCPVKDERDFAHVVREAFGQRRKTLRAIFKNVINSEQLEAIGINPLARAETLSLADFAHLSDCYSDLNRD